MFAAPLPAECYRDLHISDRVLGPTCTATLATATLTCTKAARKRTEEGTGPLGGETTKTFVKEEKAFQDKHAGKSMAQ